MIRLVTGRLDYRGIGGVPAIMFLDGIPDMELKP
jgi:hypothetical protein